MPVSYKYDAWGRPISKTGTLANTLGKINPFRYRGYVYDEETELYYLRSRYFDFLNTRFLNADNYLGNKNRIPSHNVFAYCVNNPIVFNDPSGHYVCSSLYMFAVTEAERDAHYDFSDSTIGDELTQCLANSEVFRKVLWTSMKEQFTTSEVSFPLTFSFGITESDYPSLYSMATMDDLDLFFAIRKCEVTITLSPSTGNLADMASLVDCTVFDVSYTLTDRFDFNKLSPTNGKASFVQWFNDEFGYKPQEAGTLNPFSFSVSGEMYLIMGQGLFDLTK